MFHVLTHCLEIVGEAANQVSLQSRSSHPEIVWPLIIGMRNRLIHAYFDVDIYVVWQSVTEDLPVLTEQIRQLLIEAEE